MVLLFSACTNETVINIDTFISLCNKSEFFSFKKEDFASYEYGNKTLYTTEIGDSQLIINCNKHSKEVIGINLCCENNTQNEAKDIFKKLIVTATGKDTQYAEKITAELIDKATNDDSNYKKSYIFLKDLTFGFISADVGCLFYLNYNEIESIVSTQIPEFQENYTDFFMN